MTGRCEAGKYLYCDDLVSGIEEALSITRLEKSWHGGDEPFDFSDAKGVVEGLLNQFGISAGFEQSSDESFDSDKQWCRKCERYRYHCIGTYSRSNKESFCKRQFKYNHFLPW